MDSSSTGTRSQRGAPELIRGGEGQSNCTTRAIPRDLRPQLRHARFCFREDRVGEEYGSANAAPLGGETRREHPLMDGLSSGPRSPAINPAHQCERDE